MQSSDDWDFFQEELIILLPDTRPVEDFFRDIIRDGIDTGNDDQGQAGGKKQAPDNG